MASDNWPLQVRRRPRRSLATTSLKRVDFHKRIVLVNTDGHTLYELYGEAYTPWDWHSKLKRVAEEEGIDLSPPP